MKHIKLYEQFTTINEAEKQLPGGYINDHTASLKDLPIEYKKDKTYFVTNLTTDTDKYGRAGSLNVERSDKSTNYYLDFKSKDFAQEERQITTGRQLLKPDSEKTQFVLAKTQEEAKRNCFNILLHANQVANGDFDAPGLGNLVKAFFEIRKLYPEYMSLNPLFSGFIQGVSTGFFNPKLTGDLARIENAKEMEEMLKKEVPQALKEIGVIK